MGEKIKVAGLSIGAIALVVFVVLFVATGSYMLYKTFAPKYEAVRYDVFKHSQAHVEGTISHIQRLRMDYESSDNDAHRDAIRRMILTEVTKIERDKLPDELDRFISTLSKG